MQRDYEAEAQQFLEDTEVFQTELGSEPESATIKSLVGTPGDSSGKHRVVEASAEELDAGGESIPDSHKLETAQALRKEGYTLEEIEQVLHDIDKGFANFQAFKKRSLLEASSVGEVQPSSKSKDLSHRAVLEPKASSVGVQAVEFRRRYSVEIDVLRVLASAMEGSVSPKEAA